MERNPAAGDFNERFSEKWILIAREIKCLVPSARPDAFEVELSLGSLKMAFEYDKGNLRHLVPSVLQQQMLLLAIKDNVNAFAEY